MRVKLHLRQITSGKHAGAKKDLFTLIISCQNPFFFIIQQWQCIPFLLQPMQH